MPIVPGASSGQRKVAIHIGRDHYYAGMVAAGHILNADEPQALGGGDQAHSPYELLMSALGACTAFTLRMYAERKQWPLEAVDVRLSHVKDTFRRGCRV